MLTVDLDALQEERWQLFRMGVPFSDWERMTRWQRRDFLVRHQMDLFELLKTAKRGLSGLIAAVVSKILR
jgi:hypothetical protein